MKKTILIEIDEEFLENMKKQKRAILVLQSSVLIPNEATEELEGTLNFFDHIQDKAVDELGFDKNKVLDLGPDEDEQPEEFKAWQNEFYKSVRKLDDSIIKLVPGILKAKKSKWKKAKSKVRSLFLYWRKESESKKK